MCETKKLGFDNDKSANDLNTRHEAPKEMKAENERFEQKAMKIRYSYLE